MKPNKPLKEIIIVVSVFVGLWLISFLISYLSGNRSLDINMHDTYVIGGSMWTNSIMPVFLWLITIGYFIRASVYKFNERTQNIILLVSCAGLNILMLIYLKEISRFSGMTFSFQPIKPPTSISYLGKNDINYDDIVQSSFITQIILIFLLAIIAAITTKNWKPNKNAL